MAEKEGSVSTESNNNSSKLTSKLLNGKNYMPWARAATISLRGRGKLAYVTGKKPKPKDNSEEWEMCDSQIMSSILSSIEPQLSEQFVYSDTSAELWEEIRKWFGKQNNFAHIFQIKLDIVQTKQNNQSISQFFGTMKTKWDELDIHQPEVT